jgi:hypothetical protein
MKGLMINDHLALWKYARMASRNLSEKRSVVVPGELAYIDADVCASSSPLTRAGSRVAPLPFTVRSRTAC